MSIFVGNLPFRSEREDVIELFAPFGEVVNCALPLERDTGRKRGFAFVEMVDDDMENRAIDGLQGAEMMGRSLRINKAEPRGAAAPRRGGAGGGYGGGGGYGRSRESGGYGSGSARTDFNADRSSGAQGWEDRSFGGRDRGVESLESGRMRRRRSGGSASAPDASGADGDSRSADYGGAEV